MEITTEQADVPALDRAHVLAVVGRITSPRLEVPPLTDTLERMDTVAGMLRALVDHTRGDQREAVRVMRRLSNRLLDAPPHADATPFTAWQHLVNLARCTEAFIDVERRTA
ncbi:hypothetical protein ACWDY7_10700 [Streptomyces calvus]|uniref:Uncharacterized protein n=1 Tax=Streptomyces calvus TaxID=67282 RepID=A0AA40SCM3_9ACTN|nr:hypothetical protein [Streptomyces calvus]MBA8944054.1 hypothetical protein [Streptomyces calvus]GGP57957.1 hypothetical protein GCM10010247_33330 [Streptomyces calvus]